MSELSQKRNDFIDDYLNYYPVIYSAVYSRIDDSFEADDLCQEIFIIFYRKFDSIGNENKRRWLYATAKNVVLNYYKKKRALKVKDIDEAWNLGLSFVNGFRDTRIILNEAMENIKCDDTERIILDLIAVHNFSYSSVSDIIGLNERQVRYKYDILIKKLYKQLHSLGIKDLEELL